MNSKLFAVMATVGLVLFALGPGVATVAAEDDSLDVAVEQSGNDGPTVTVTENETAVENATVGVDALENTSYDGAGNYTTDENGTVSLPTAEENATIEVTASYNNTSVSETEELSTANETENASFGTEVSAFVQSLLDGGEENIGPQVADFVTSNNPGNAPDHAGPPSDNQTGPPENAGPPADNETGPPADVGPDSDNETDDRRGPPADAGPGSDDGNETEDSDEEELETEEDEDDDEELETEEADDDDDDDDDDDGGPPEDAGNARGN
jgi:hypothetical protein